MPASLAGRLAKAGGVLTGDLQQADLSDLRVRLGDSLLTGSATLDWAPAQSVLRADLASERLDLATFLDLKGTGGGGAAEPTLAGLSVLDADVRLRADSMLIRGLELQRVDATARLRSGKLEVDPLAFDFLGSPLRGALTLDGAAEPNRVALDASSEALDIGRLLAGLGASELVEGRARCVLPSRPAGRRLRHGGPMPPGICAS